MNTDTATVTATATAMEADTVMDTERRTGFLRQVAWTEDTTRRPRMPDPVRASAVRAGSYITIDDCPGTDQEWVQRLVGEALDSVHRVEPARLSAVNVPLDDMRAAVSLHAQAGSAAAKMAALRSLGLRGGALAELGAALEDPHAEALAYARAHVDTDTVWSQTVLNVRDTASGTTQRVSVSSAGGQGDGMSLSPSISADGRYVAFESDATNLVARDTNRERDIFVRDLQDNVTRRASISSTGKQSDGISAYASISANGQYVAFESYATTFEPGLGQSPGIYVHDMSGGLTWSANRAAGSCFTPSMPWASSMPCCCGSRPSCFPSRHWS